MKRKIRASSGRHARLIGFEESQAGGAGENCSTRVEQHAFETESPVVHSVHQASCWELSCPIFPSTPEVLGIQTPYCVWCYVGFGDLNSGPLACMASALSIELSSKPLRRCPWSPPPGSVTIKSFHLGTPSCSPILIDACAPGLWCQCFFSPFSLYQGICRCAQIATGKTS